MGFSKKSYEPEIAIIVTHPLYPDPFTFFFPKKMPQEAIDASSRWLGLKDLERAEERDKAFVEMLTSQMSRAPLGFDDLSVNGNLAQSLTDYFYDPSQPELLDLLLEAKRVYNEVTSPRGYFRRAESDSAGSSDASGATPQAASGL